MYRTELQCVEFELSSYVVTGDQGGDSQAVHIGWGRGRTKLATHITLYETIPNLSVPYQTLVCHTKQNQCSDYDVPNDTKPKDTMGYKR